MGQSEQVEGVLIPEPVLYVPAVQSEQFETPVAELYVPVEHSVHVVIPDPVPNVPVAQGEHVELAVSVLYDPAAQRAHMYTSIPVPVL